LNSRISNWTTAVINAMEEFKSDFRCITMDQRNATGGESTGPVPVDDPWGAFADDQLGLMDHLGVRQFFFFGNCIGGSYALKLMERAPERIVAGVLSQPIGHRAQCSGSPGQAPRRRAYVILMERLVCRLRNYSTAFVPT
jgi:pimeloyl-ACP methyl ester carboxylesterase